MAFICNRCGREWGTDPRLIEPCPKCGAKAGAHCRRPSGHAGPFVEPHAEREQLAVEHGHLAICKGPALPAPVPEAFPNKQQEKLF